MKKPKPKSKLKQSLKSNIDKIKTKIKPQLTWFSQLLSTENKAKLKTVWLKVDARYAATPKVDKVVIGSAAVLAMGSVAWAAVPAVGTGTGNQEANVAGAQVQIYDRGGQIANSLIGKFTYSMGTKGMPPPLRGRNIQAGKWTDCSSWTSYLTNETIALINKTIPSAKVTYFDSFGSALGAAEQMNYMVGRKQILYTRAWRGSPSGPLPTMKPGMLILQGGPGTEYPGRSVHFAGTEFMINHVQVVVRIAGKLYVSDSRGKRDSLSPVAGSGRGGANLYTDFQSSTKYAFSNPKYNIVIGDPLLHVRALLGDTTSAALDGNVLATGESPGVGEIGGTPGLFGQVADGKDDVIEGSEYLGDNSTEGLSVSNSLYELVMGRSASSSWQRGISLASEPRLIAELAYMKTIQNILAQARAASIERREALSGAFLGNYADSALSGETAKQRAVVTEGGGN